MVQERIQQGIGPMALRRMGHDPGRLIQDQTGAIFEQDVERLRLPIESQRHRRGSIECNDIAGFDPPARFGRSMVDPDPAGRNQPLQRRTRELGFTVNQKHIQPFRLLTGCNDKFGLHNPHTLLQRRCRMQSERAG